MKRTLATLVASLVLSVSAHAQTILFDNTSASRGGDEHVATGSGLNGPLSQSFSTGGSAVSLQSVSLLLNRDAALPSGSFSVSLWSDDGSGSPGTFLSQIGALNDTALPSSPTLLDFNPATSSSILTANTRYWIHVSSASDTQALWSYSADDQGSGVAGEYFANDAGVFDVTYGPYMMRVTVTAVPEPSTVAAAAAIALLGIGVWRKARG